jgi:hypothetical protein
MEGRLYFLIYIIFLAYVAQKDYYNHQYKQQHVYVGAWICHKNTTILRSYQTKNWNETLFTLPGVKEHANRVNKPVENLISPKYIVEVPYSDEAALQELYPNWNDREDSVCLFILEPLSICNLFEGCSYWLLFAPFKPVGWIILWTIQE